MRPARSGTPEAVRQFLTGNDFESPERVIADLTADHATAVPADCPYSIARQVAHMLFWQKRWLGRIDELPLERKKGKHGDWPAVMPAQWNGVRGEFLMSLETARKKSNDQIELARRLWNGDTVDEVIVQIVVHNSYHLGQIALLRQLLGIWPPAGGTDAW